DIVSELDAIACDAESRAKRFERAKKKGDRYRAESERALSARVGRILFYIMACQHKGQLMLTFSSMISPTSVCGRTAVLRAWMVCRWRRSSRTSRVTCTRSGIGCRLVHIFLRPCGSARIRRTTA